MIVAERRVGVLGTLVWDRIWHPADATDSPREQWGGLTYSLISAAAALPTGWTAVPLIRVGRDRHLQAADLLSSLDLPTDHLIAVDAETNRVDLRYRNDAERDETLTGGTGAWPWTELEPRVAGLDALYINFVSGFELDLATAKRLRGAFRGPIYADLHSLFLGEPTESAREPRVLPDAGDWLSCFDVVQLNASELSLLSPPDPLRLVSSTVREGRPLALVETRGERGARLWRGPRVASDARAWPSLRSTSSAEIETEILPLSEGPAAGDPTGCGDVWGAAFFLSLLAGHDWRSAAERAHRFAAAKMAEPRVERLPPLLRRS